MPQTVFHAARPHSCGLMKEVRQPISINIAHYEHHFSALVYLLSARSHRDVGIRFSSFDHRLPLSQAPE